MWHCDRLTRDTREWQKRECHLHTLNEGRKGSESREQLRNPRHPVWQWPWHVTRGGVTADQGRAGQMCLHSAWTVIATLLSLTSSLSWASHILWQDGILRNYGNVAQMSLCHCNWDSLSHTCHPHIILTFYCQTQPDLLMLCPFQIMFSIGNHTIKRVVLFFNHINQRVGRWVLINHHEWRERSDRNEWWLIRTHRPTSWLMWLNNNTTSLRCDFWLIQQ